MPTYEYKCDACGIEFEATKRMSDPIETTCPNCGSPTSHRLISHSSFVLKGSGWYATDYGGKKGTGTGGSKTSTSSTSSSSESTSSDTAKKSDSSSTSATPTSHHR